MSSSPPPLRTPGELASLDLEAHLADPARKQAFVTPMFEHIAPRYDDFTRLFSFGMDARWKRELTGRLRDTLPPDARVLDVACGTGDLALAAAALLPASRVIGVDVAEGMIARAAARIPPEVRGRVAFEVGDLTRLSLPSESVDAVIGGYALRNVPDYQQALGELARVVRPGGHLLTLDFYRPSVAPWRALFLGYLQLSGSVVGWLWHRAPVMYAYIAHSIRHFATVREFSSALQDAGFEIVEVRTHLLGGIALHHAVRR